MVRGALRPASCPHDSDARWNEYDWGPDGVRWLETTRAVRHVMLRRFGAAQLKPGEPYYELEKRFSLCWLYHRFAIAAAQHLVGGESVANAVAGDGQTPHAAVPAARQRAALDQLLACLDPGELDVPDAIAAALVPPPIGVARSREQIVSETGDAFSPLAAARVLAQLVIELLGAPGTRCAASLASGDALARRDAAPARRGDVGHGGRARSAARRLRHITQTVTLEAIERLAASDQATPESRATAYAALEGLRARCARVRAATPRPRRIARSPRAR